jgi:hypothetical protein
VASVCDVGADPIGAQLAMQVCDLTAESTVVVIEFADAFVCEGEALAQ